MDLSVLDKCFDLEPFHHLRKALPEHLKGTLPTEPSQTTPTEVLMGPSNAICIQMFCLDEQYEMRSVDFLVQVFTLFVGYDFLILLQPYNLPEFPLLSYFSRATPAVGFNLGQELYIFHKCALLQSFSVRYATSADVTGVENLIKDLEGQEGLLCDLKKYLHASRDPIQEGACPLCVLVGVCAEQVVGVAIVRTEEDIDYIRAHYNIEDFVYFDYHHPLEHSHLHHFVLNPVFSMHSKFFLKELMRLTHTDCVYYPLLLDQSKHRPHTVISALSEMVPIRPRRQIEYPGGLGNHTPPSSRLNHRETFALYHTNRKLSFEPKISINARLVVVGASDTSVSLLEGLVFCPHLKFNNLTLVSTDGMPWALEDDAYRSLPHSCCYMPHMYSLLGLHARVNVVKATVVSIDRSQKCIIVEDSGGDQSAVYYDFLFLLMGAQYTVPQKPNNFCRVFSVNNEYEASHFLSWVQTELCRSPEKVVVYGATLTSFTVVQALLSAGVSGHQVHLVLPPGHTPFKNPTVEERVIRVLVEMGVTVHHGYTLIQGKGEVTGLLLEAADGSLLNLPCETLVCVDRKKVAQRGFKAINDACLVFDERLVISATNHTNDPCIFAAGPVTKFSRRYRADSRSHANFNSKEVGKKLAAVVLSELDPLAVPVDHCTHDLLLPNFNSPVVQYALLPGGLWYLHIEKPNFGEQLDDAGKDQVFITDTAANGYFRLHINQYSQVETITILSSMKPEVGNFQCLYGLHEKYLNNLASRFVEGLIPDLSSYFHEPWVCALMHDRFGDLVDEMREQTTSSLDGAMYKEQVQKTLEDQDLHKARSMLVARFDTSTIKTRIRTCLFNFLHYNFYHLPMYARPDII
eukprot:Em0020g1098a